MDWTTVLSIIGLILFAILMMRGCGGMMGGCGTGMRSRRHDQLDDKREKGIKANE
jgi:hypothetical protein